MHSVKLFLWFLSVGIVFSVDHFETGRDRSKAQVGSAYTSDAEADRITSLPGWGELDFGMFGGYVTVDDKAGRALYYIFVEAESDVANKPVLLWLNGGPGCSSLGGGFLSELGPFYPTASANGSLQANPHSWHRFASVIFLDSPAFVGFSYSNATEDKFVGDHRTAVDSRVFLEGFFARFPQYAAHDLYLTGESYAGHYVPNLAVEILKPSSTGNSGPKINLKGFLVGNPWTDTATENLGAIDYWWSHGIISDESAQGVVDNCDFAHIGPLMAAADRPTNVPAESKWAPRQLLAPSHRHGDRQDNPFDKCEIYCYQALWEMGNINIYDILADVCISDANATVTSLSPVARSQRAALPARQLGRMLRHAPAHLSLSTRSALSQQDPPYDPCVDDEVESYFRRQDVQQALHARPPAQPWSDCNEDLQYSYDDLLSTVLPVYRELLKSDLRILVYSGDVDAIVPVIGTRRWVAALGRPVVKAWRPWVSSTKQVGGYIVDYQGITFATVRGAGHMVPYVQPERAFVLVSSFLSGRDPNTGSSIGL